MHPRLRRRLRPIAAVVLVFFSWFSIEPWNYALAAQDLPTTRVTSAASPPKAPSAPEIFETDLRFIKEQVRAAREGEAFQAQLAGLLKNLEQAVAQSGHELEATRQAVDRLARAIEQGAPSQEAIKILHTQRQTLKAAVGQVRLNASGIEGLLRGMALPASLSTDQKQAKEAVAGLTKTFDATLTAITQRAEQKHQFDVQDHQAFLTASTELDQGLAALQARVQVLSKEATPERRRAQLWQEAFSKRDSLLSTDKAIRKEFDQTEAFLKEKGLPQEILDRQKAAVSDYEKNFTQLTGYFAQVDKANRAYVSATERGNEAASQAAERDLESKLTAFDDFLKANVKDPPHQPLDPNNLPHRTPKPTDRKPRLKKEEFAEFQPQIRLAYNGDPATLLLAQATTDLPKPEDLAETIEVQFTPEIQALATELEHNPVKIYNWVRNNIDFVPTYGSIQGARMCLLTKQCNDMDTASLLIALLRTSGVAARYVIGTIEVPIEQVMNWVGDFTDERAALSFIASGGTPVTGRMSGGRVIAAQLEHVWVEAYVDYVPSRGAVQNESDTWVPIDASFKTVATAPGLDIGEISGFDAQSFLASVLASGTVDPVTGSVTSLDAATVTGQADTIQQAVSTYVTDHQLAGTLDTVAGSRVIAVRSPRLLFGHLPYRVAVRASPIAALPDSIRHQVTVELFDQVQTPTLSYSTSLPELASKRVTLSYSGATSADQTLLDNAAQSGATSLAVYLIKVVPQLRIEGQIVARGVAEGMGTPQTVAIRLTGPWEGDRIPFPIRAGDYDAFVFNLARASLDHLNVRAARLADNYFTAVEQGLGIQTGSQIPTDDLVGEGLSQNLLAWWAERDFYAQAMARQQRVNEAYAPSLGLSGSPLSTSMLFGVPHQGTYRGFLLDIKRVVTLTEHSAGDQSAMIAYNLATGMMGSALEGEVLAQVHTLKAPPVSAAALLAESNRIGIPIYKLTSSNAMQILPLLNLPGALLTDISNAVAAGKTIITPGRPTTVGAFTGTGYLVLDPDAGTGGYLISGGFAGGGGETDPSAVAVGQIPPNQQFLGFIIPKAASAGGTAVEIGSKGEVLVRPLQAGGPAAGGGGAATGVAAATVAAIIAVAVIVSVFLTADGNTQVARYRDAIGRTISLDERKYAIHITPHAQREGFDRSDVDNCLHGIEPERIEVWLSEGNYSKVPKGGTALICALAPEKPGKVLFIPIGPNFYVETAFIPNVNPYDEYKIVETSWYFILQAVTERYTLSLFGDISVDPAKTYTINAERRAERKSGF